MIYVVCVMFFWFNLIVNFLDIFGYVDFMVEVECCL